MERPIYCDLFAEQNKILSQKGYVLDAFQMKGIQEREDILYGLQEEYMGTDKTINHIQPLVSVCIPTYQHVKYIEQCLEGALMQETTFPIEIIVGDDGSVDGTVDICKKYAEKFSDKIRFFDRKRSLTRVFDSEAHIERACNWWWTLKDARGKYIAICEGDDYWIEPLKLQKQVDFLENHPEYVYSCHRYDIYNELTKDLILASNKYFDNRKNVLEHTFDLKYAFQVDWITKTLTCMYRRDVLNFSDLSQFKYVRDVHMVYYILLKGKGVCHSFVGGVYRKNPYSVFGSQPRGKQIAISYKVYEEFYQVTHDVIFKTLLMSLFMEQIKITRKIKFPKNKVEWECLFIYIPCKVIRKLKKGHINNRHCV